MTAGLIVPGQPPARGELLNAAGNPVAAFVRSVGPMRLCRLDTDGQPTDDCVQLGDDTSLTMWTRP